MTDEALQQLGNIQNLSHHVTRLVQEAKEQHETIQSQGPNMVPFQSQVDVLMERMYVERSYIRQLSDWLMRRRWWQKLLIWLAVMAIFFVLGIGVHLFAAIACMVLGGLFSFGGYFLLRNDYRVHEESDARLREDITQLEQSVSVSTRHMHVLEMQFKSLLASLSAHHLQMARDLSDFEDLLRSVHEKVMQLQTVITDLENNNMLLKEHSCTLEGQMKTLFLRWNGIVDDLSTEYKKLLATGENGPLLKDKYMTYLPQCEQQLTLLQTNNNALQALLPMLEKTPVKVEKSQAKEDLYEHHYLEDVRRAEETITHVLQQLEAYQECGQEIEGHYSASSYVV